MKPLLPVSNGRCGRWRDHRQVINGVLHRVRTGVQWRVRPPPSSARHGRNRLTARPAERQVRWPARRLLWR
ncbi:hypothetical protein K1Y78_45365 [Streptomyces sp. tea 10]|nr:hypothetical protein [Streptomyces sp. tea 10]